MQPVMERGYIKVQADKLEIINFNWLGLDLSQIPKLKFWENGISWASVGLFLIPIVVTVLNVGYSKLSQRTNNFNKNQKNSNPTADQTNKIMMFVMPIMYLWFGYIMPAGMCVYMAFNAIFMAIQELICARMLRGKYAEMEAARQKRIEEEKERERQHKAEIAARRAAEAEERKKNAGKHKSGQKQKKAPAPKESRVGMRTYARGRAYDPDRYTVTPYRDPNGGAEEALPEETLPEAETPVETVPAVEAPAAPEAVSEPAAVEEPAAVPEDQSESEKTADQLFAEINAEAASQEDDKDE